uniref:MPL proto-onco, thrombopoietin receptor n=1 Tax=Chrysemys picta bellii TaxID=8478 RepID=A0A8C3F751_CHRPI
MPPAGSSLSPSPLNSSLLHADVALLREVSETIRCFSRSFEDLTCFWDEEEAEHGNHTYRFYYTYNGEKAKECVLAVQRRSGGGRRYVCVFPSSHEVRLFAQLCIRVLDTPSNQTKYSREVAVEKVGLIAPPVNITATWTGAAGELQVSWEPPATEYTEFFIYEILYCIVGSMEPPRQSFGGVLLEARTVYVVVEAAPTFSSSPSLVPLLQKQVRSTRACVLHTLQPGAKYHIRIRTKPDGLSLDGFWGPWSQAVAAETPQIGLRCFTSDLQWASQLDSRAPCFLPRGQAWQRCQEHSTRPQNTHACMFQPRNDSDIFILVNISRGHPEPVLSYFGEPFRMHQAVLTSPPRILQANISGGQLRLQWAPPEEELAEYMVYQIRYSVENSLDWKVIGDCPPLQERLSGGLAPPLTSTEVSRGWAPPTGEVSLGTSTPLTLQGRSAWGLAHTHTARQPPPAGEGSGGTGAPLPWRCSNTMERGPRKKGAKPNRTWPALCLSHPNPHQLYPQGQHRACGVQRSISCLTPCPQGVTQLSLGRSCRSSMWPTVRPWTCVLAPATSSRCEPSPMGSSSRGSGVPGQRPSWWRPLLEQVWASAPDGDGPEREGGPAAG